MNKPAPKEPSMDEILSSIRQIIADDDAGASASHAPAMAGVAPSPIAVPPIQSMPLPPSAAMPASGAKPEGFGSFGAGTTGSSFLKEVEDDPEENMAPLALSSAQILEEAEDAAEEADVSSFSFDSILDQETPTVTDAAPLIDPEDIAFAPEPESAPSFEIPSFDPPPAAPAHTPSQQSARPSPSVAQVAPLPDPTLSADMANRLIEPATSAAVRSTFTRLNGLALGNAGLTIEQMMREMLRPMLKEWLDENLPAVVERMVEKEISRISRGVD